MGTVRTVGVPRGTGPGPCLSLWHCTGHCGTVPGLVSLGGHYPGLVSLGGHYPGCGVFGSISGFVVSSGQYPGLWLSGLPLLGLVVRGCHGLRNRCHCVCGFDHEKERQVFWHRPSGPNEKCSELVFSEKVST